MKSSTNLRYRIYSTINLFNGVSHSNRPTTPIPDKYYLFLIIDPNRSHTISFFNWTEHKKRIIWIAAINGRCNRIHGILFKVLSIERCVVSLYKTIYRHTEYSLKWTVYTTIHITKNTIRIETIFQQTTVTLNIKIKSFKRLAGFGVRRDRAKRISRRPQNWIKNQIY